MCGNLLTGESQSIQRETCSCVSLCTTNPTWISLCLNLVLCGEKLVTDCLNHGITHEGNEGMQCGNKGDCTSWSDPALDHETDRADSYDN